MNIIRICILCFLIIILIGSMTVYINEPFDGMNALNVEAPPVLIVSRYSETLDWLNEEPAASFPTIIYNKGSDENYTTNVNTIRTVNTANLGRCDGTYVRFIVENYDNLPDVMVFLPGSANMDNKKEKMRLLLEKVQREPRTTSFVNYPPEKLDPNDEADHSELYNFQLDDWTASNKLNQHINSESALAPARIRPYGKWFETVLGEKFSHRYGNAGIFGIFAVSKHDVLKRDKDFYVDLLEQLEVSSNPEVGHYCERSWPVIFQSSL